MVCHAHQHSTLFWSHNKHQRLIIDHSSPVHMQVFLRDAEQVDSSISAQEAFLGNTDLGTSVDNVEELLTKHNEFMRTSSAVDDRVRALSEMANRLVHAIHYDADRYEGLCMFGAKVCGVRACVWSEGGWYESLCGIRICGVRCVWCEGLCVECVEYYLSPVYSDNSYVCVTTL